MKVFWDPVQLGRAPHFFLQRGRISPHFEVPARAEALVAARAALGLEPMPPPEPRPVELEALHPPEFFDFLRDAAADWAALPDAGEEAIPSPDPTPEMLAQGGHPARSLVGRTDWFTYDPASRIAAGTWPAGLATAAADTAAADTAAEGQSAYALVRPSGRHRCASRMGGHCYVDNAALAAEQLGRRGVARVAVLDIESHHGDDAQGTFWERPDLLTVSVHGDPDRYDPWFVGRAGERGSAAGASLNRQLPLAFGTTDDGWLAAIGTGLDAIRTFRADAVVVSLGLDASKHDALDKLAVTDDGFARAGAAIDGVRLPTAIVQERGYNIDAIGGLVRRLVEGFRENAAPS